MPNISIFHDYRRQEKTIMKLVVDAETDKVLGASMCGPDAAEIMQVNICCMLWNAKHIVQLCTWCTLYIIVYKAHLYIITQFDIQLPNMNVLTMGSSLLVLLLLFCCNLWISSLLFVALFHSLQAEGAVLTKKDM